jgi:hypothetical protein
MGVDPRSGLEYRGPASFPQLSMDDELWNYCIAFYRYEHESLNTTNLSDDERVLRRNIAFGVYDNEDTSNGLHARRAMMHGSVMAERLWALIRRERFRVCIDFLHRDRANRFVI